MKTLKTALLVLLCIPLIYYSCSKFFKYKGGFIGVNFKGTCYNRRSFGN